jgi:3-oxoacyl-[acyl-carrier protein] reductase
MRRVAIITGGSRGIGRSFADALLAAGHAVTITGARDAAALERARTALAAAHGDDHVHAILADAGAAEDADRTVAETRARFGRLDILINNAGRGPREVSPTFHREPPKFWQTAPENWAEIVRSNINGPFLMSRAAAPHMVAQGWGRIVGISTSRVTMVRQGFAPYGATKAALDSMSRIFAQDLEGTGVTVNILLPGGATDTDFIPPEGRSGAYLNLLPVDVMNDALLWLVSEEADGITAGRFVGARWDPDDKTACREDTGAPPLIL